MPKFLKKTLILIIITAIFLAPISGGVKINEVKAQTNNYAIYKNILPDSSVVWQNSSQTVAEFLVNIQGPQTDWDKAAFANWDSLYGYVSPKIHSMILVVMENGNYVSSYDLSSDIAKVTKTTGIPLNYSLVGPKINNQYVTVGGLSAGKTYTAELYYTSTNGAGGGIDLFTATNKNYYKFGKSTSFNTPKDGEQIIGDYSVTAPKSGTNTPGGGLDLGCSLNPFSPNLTGCLAGILYTVWEASAWIARLGGSFLDFFVYYATNSSSYSNEFVSQAWGAVRDIANIFFIIALLYVAIKTILGLNVTDNKKLIGAVIIVGLIINFSLFTTKIVIDGSNILAKVFYNNITSTKTGTTDAAIEAGGQKSVSIGIINKFNPQEIVSDQTEYDKSPGTFIFITIMALLVTLYTAYIFFSVALLFLGRVVSLWISMVFSPIAFASYTVPFEIPGFGHKEWWKGLFENAILAPLFIFFLYVIILFTNFLKTITIYPTGSDTIQHIMGVVIPFAIIILLLTQAKKLAVKYAGDIGKIVQSVGGAVGGLALGTAALSTAAVGRGTIGAIAKNVQNDTARKNALSFKDTRDKWNSMNKLNPLSYLGLAGKAVAGTGKAATALAAQGIYSIPGTKGRTIGQHMQAGDEASGKKQTSQKTLDSVAKSEFGGKFGYEEDVKFKDLKENQQIEVRKAIDRDQIAKDYYKASDWKSIKEDADRKLVSQNVDTAYNNYKTTAQTNPAQAEADLKQQLNFAGLRNKDSSGDMLKFSKANVGLGQFVQALRKGTYDVRNLPNVGIGAKGITKLGLGITAAVATGMRAGLKSSLNVNAGTPQKNIMKDIGNTITEALKSVSFDVKLGGDGGGGHGGGGGHAKPAAGGHGKPATGGHGAHH